MSSMSLYFWSGRGPSPNRLLSKSYQVRIPVPDRWIQYPGLSAVWPAARPFAIASAAGTESADSAVSEVNVSRKSRYHRRVVHTDDNVGLGSRLLDHIGATQVAVHELDVGILFGNSFGALFATDKEFVLIVWVFLVDLGKGSASDEACGSKSTTQTP